MMDAIRGFMDKLKRKESTETTIADESKGLFPTDAHGIAAQELYGILDPSQAYGMDNTQYRWVGETNHPWELQPNAFHDMIETSENMPNEVKNAAYNSYYTMNTPDNVPHEVWQNWISKQKNIDILISAANRDDSPYNK
jgi:hypothetical protein